MNLWIQSIFSDSWGRYLFLCFFCSRRPLIINSIIRIWNWFLISISFINCHNIFIHKVPDIIVYFFVANIFILIILLSKLVLMSKFSIFLIWYWRFDFFIYRINVLVDKMIRIIIYFFITNVLFFRILLSKWTLMSKFTIIFIWYWLFNLFIYINNIFIHKMKNIIIYFFITNIFFLWFLLNKWFRFRNCLIFFILNSFRFIKSRSWISFVAVWKSLQIKHIIWKSWNPRIKSFLTKRCWFWFIIKLNRSIKFNCLWTRE